MNKYSVSPFTWINESGGKRNGKECGSPTETYLMEHVVQSKVRGIAKKYVGMAAGIKRWQLLNKKKTLNF